MTDDEGVEVIIEEGPSHTEIIDEANSDFECDLDRTKRIRSIDPNEEKENNPPPRDGNCEENGDDNGVDGCPICFEPWTSGGLHRVCSLRCGHLFGKQ